MNSSSAVAEPIPRASAPTSPASITGPTARSRGRSLPKAARNRSSSTRCSATERTVQTAMNHFDYRNGVLHAEAVNLSELADAVGTPFYCYSTATLERHYRVFTEAFAGEKVAGVLRHEGELQPVRAAHAGKARRRRRRGVGRRVEARAGRRHPRRTRSCSPASARPRPSCAPRSPPTSSASTSSPSPSSNCCRGSRSKPARPRAISVRVNPDVDAGTHAKIATGKSENKFGVPIARAREVYARAARLPGLAGRPASTCISAARSPI